MNTDSVRFSGAWIHNGNGVFIYTYDNQHCLFPHISTHIISPGEEEVLDHGDPNKVPNLKHVMNPEGKSCSLVKSS